MKRLIKLTSQLNFYFGHESPEEQTSPTANEAKHRDGRKIMEIKIAINYVTAVHPLKDVRKVRTPFTLKNTGKEFLGKFICCYQAGSV